ARTLAATNSGSNRSAVTVQVSERITLDCLTMRSIPASAAAADNAVPHGPKYLFNWPTDGISQRANAPSASKILSTSAFSLLCAVHWLIVFLPLNCLDWRPDQYLALGCHRGSHFGPVSRGSR